MIDNPMVSGLRQLEEKRDAYQKRHDAARDEAEERLLLDMDTFSAWLTEQCYLTSPVQFPAIPQDPADMQILIESMDVPALLAASIHPFARVRSAASYVLSQRYIKDHPATIDRLVDEIMGASNE